MTDSLWVLRMVVEQFHRDDEDRPIREGRTPRELLRDGDIEYRTCPFAGSRYHHPNPMNVSALRQTSEHWDELIATVAFLRAAYTEARGGYAGDVMDLWRVSQLGSALPWWFILRGEVAPAYAANLAKVMLGVGVWGQRMFVKTFLDRWVPDGPLTSAAIVELAEQTDTLISDTEVCSAPDKMMVRFFDVMTLPPEPTDPCPLAATRDDVIMFGAHYLGFKQLLYAHYLARRFVYADLAAAIGTGPELRELLDATCEPPDFFMIEPANPAAVPLEHRAAWFRALAELIVPFAPDRSDDALRSAGLALAAAMADPAPRDVELVAAEVADPALARPLATYARLDAILADAVAAVESGFRRAAHAPVPGPAVDAAARDRLVSASPRAWLTSLAPRAMGVMCRP